MRRTLLILLGIASCLVAGSAVPDKVPASEPDGKQEVADFLGGRFWWQVGAPAVSAVNRPDDPCFGIKDPSIVQYQDRWHLFYTSRNQKPGPMSKVPSRKIEYCSFADWPDADKAPRHILTLTERDFGAPQVFYFTPHKKWYLLCFEIDNRRRPNHYPIYATSDNIADPRAWSKPAELFPTVPDNVKEWIDFWIICDRTRAHFFFTSLDGRMWRADTRLADFPAGWGKPEVVLRGNFFEASHTYRLKGMDKSLTVIEAIDGVRSDADPRYHQAYLADKLDGEWKPLAAGKDQPFAGPANVRFTGEAWADSFSHGEMLRAGYDEQLEVDPANLRFLFQGVSNAARKGKPYGEIPWRLGVLEPDRGKK
jgi:hypothetical protein